MGTTPNASDSEILRNIEARLSQILRLTALQMTTGLKQAPAIELLGAAGIDRNAIADLLHTTPNTVSVTLSKSAKKKRSV
jgi:DNA-binding CsgD family transcriptional regulator